MPMNLGGYSVPFKEELGYVNPKIAMGQTLSQGALQMFLLPLLMKEKKKQDRIKAVETLLGLFRGQQPVMREMTSPGIVPVTPEGVRQPALGTPATYGQGRPAEFEELLALMSGQEQPTSKRLSFEEPPAKISGRGGYRDKRNTYMIRMEQGNKLSRANAKNSLDPAEKELWNTRADTFFKAYNEIARGMDIDSILENLPEWEIEFVETPTERTGLAGAWERGREVIGLPMKSLPPTRTSTIVEKGEAPSKRDRMRQALIKEGKDSSEKSIDKALELNPSFK